MAENLRPGEVYAGILLGKKGEPDQHIFLLSSQLPAVSWDNAREWAVQIGGDLPTPREQALLYANARSKFKRAGNYWSSESFKPDSNYAWSQNFRFGHQFDSHKRSRGYACAVRRVAI